MCADLRSLGLHWSIQDFEVWKKNLGGKAFGLGEKANDCVKKKRQRLSDKENAWVKKTKRVLQADHLGELWKIQRLVVTFHGQSTCTSIEF